MKKLLVTFIAATFITAIAVLAIIIVNAEISEAGPIILAKGDESPGAHKCILSQCSPPHIDCKTKAGNNPRELAKCERIYNSCINRCKRLFPIEGGYTK